MLDMKWVQDQMNKGQLSRVARAEQEAANAVVRKRSLPRQRQFITGITLGLIVGVTIVKCFVRV